MLIKSPLPVILATVSALCITVFINGCSDSASADAKHAEYRLPNSDIRLTITIQSDEKERVVRATDGDQELFKTKLDKNPEGKTRTRLYKNKESYTLVDGNGERYLLNMREKRFEKSTDDKNAAGATYVGKFDFDKKHNWRFIPSKQLAQTDDTPSAATPSSSSEKGRFGPPSKQFR